MMSGLPVISGTSSGGICRSARTLAGALVIFSQLAYCLPLLAQLPPDSIGNTSPPAPGDDELKDLGPQEMPAPLTSHQSNKSLHLDILRSTPVIQIATLAPERLEAKFNRVVTLKEVLAYALRNSLAIRINDQTAKFNRSVFFGGVGGFLPNVSTNLFHTNGNVSLDTSIHSTVFTESLNFPVFQGGTVLYGALAYYNGFRAAQQQYFASINDTLINTYNAYYSLVLQRAVQQIRLKAVQVSQLQLRLNEDLYRYGTGTQFAIMQSRTQLGLDEQALVRQEVATRQAALQLAFIINMPLVVNLIPAENTVTEEALLDETPGVNEWLSLSVTHRPELREYERLRLSSRNLMRQAGAPLYPTAQWNITYAHTQTSIGGSGKALGSLSTYVDNPITGTTLYTQSPTVGLTTAGQPNLNGTVLPASQLVQGVGSAVPITGSNLPSQIIPGSNGVFAPVNSTILTPVVPDTGSLSISSGLAATAPPAQIIPGTGALTVTPGLSNTTVGSVTGATTTSGLGNTVVTTTNGNLDTLVPIVGAVSPNLVGTPLVTVGPRSVVGNIALAGQNVGSAISILRNTVTLPLNGNSVAVGFNCNWTLGQLGGTDLANVMRNRTQARNRLLQGNLAIQQVEQQVRSSYLNALAARQQIDVTAASVASAREQLRMSNLRLQTGVGTNLELIQAQRAYIQALINQAQSIIASNQAQAQLLHDAGVISLDTLTQGFRKRIGFTRNNRI